ncbi:MAG: hypothetical protein IKO20_05240 [Bacteroidaceae bacterium]|nr:hypothetical protein [Bacteroidaceae bacterium]
MKSHIYYPKTLNEAPAYIFKSMQEREDSELVFVPDFTLQPRSFLHKVLKFLFIGRIPVNGKWAERITGYKGWQWLKTLKPADRLLLNGVTNLKTLKAIAWLTPKGVRRYQYFNNCLRFVLPPEVVAYRVKRMHEMGYTLVTFDPQEAEEHKMVYAPQFYRFPDNAPAKEIKYDFFFCGEAKDRGERLNRLKQQLEEQGFKCLFIVVGTGDKRITYEQYIEHVRESRCLVDLFREGQVGITRRPVEALFFDKKLLTENPQITAFDFFRRENILAMEPSSNLDTEAVKHFMQMPFASIPNEIKERYTVEQWLTYFKD